MTKLFNLIGLALLVALSVFGAWVFVSYINVILFNLGPDPMVHIPAWNFFRVLVGM